MQEVYSAVVEFNLEYLNNCIMCTKQFANKLFIYVLYYE